MFVKSKAATQEWGTPPEIWKAIVRRFGTFDLDPAAADDLHLCDRYYTWEGLDRPWEGRVFVNPPYSQISRWVEKAFHETEVGNAEVVVMLGKVDTSTEWFHTLVLPFAEVVWLRRRVRYLERQWEISPRSRAGISVGCRPGQSAPFASALYIWRRY